MPPAYAPFDPRHRARAPGLGDFWSDLGKAIGVAKDLRDLIFSGTSTQARIDQAIVGTVDLAFSQAMAGDLTARSEFGGLGPVDYMRQVAAVNVTATVRQYAAAKYQQYLAQRGTAAGFGGPMLWIIGGGLAAAALLTFFSGKRGAR